MDMRLLASVLLTVLASFGIVVTGGAGPALACSCAFQRFPEYVAYADAVFVGTLAEIEGPAKRQIMSSTDPVTYTVAVDEVYEGAVGSTTVFESAVSGASCGLDGMVVDRRYVFFTTAEGGVPTASSCGGTAPVTPRRLAAVQRLLGQPTTPSVAVVEAVRTDDDVASSGVPEWTVAAGLVGVVALLAAGLRLRRRSA
ncbi:MAG: hypothetical protein HY829_06060 [Actinobacteria bacterium]|nr:hypothetical protein [Actinomycetota bacterium]